MRIFAGLLRCSRIFAAVLLTLLQAVGCALTGGREGPAAGAGAGLPPFATAPGEASRGRELLMARDPANCVYCHALPDPAAEPHGDLGPTLAAVGLRLSREQLRLRVVDSSRLNPNTIMPSYYRTTGLRDVARQYRDKTILDEQQVEDIVAYLATLR